MKRLLNGAVAALLALACVGSAIAADVTPVITDATTGKLRPMHTGETVGVAHGGTGATAGAVTESGSTTGAIAKFSGAAVITTGNLSGDCTTTNTLAVVCTKTNGVSFAASATTDTTNAANIASGVLGSSRGGAGTVSGILKANGSGVVSAATSATDYAPATSGSSILYGNGSGGFSSVTIGSGCSFVAPTLACTGTATGTVTTSGSPASGNLAKFSGAAAVTNGDLSGDVTTSGTLATTIANDAVTTSKILNANVTLAKIANASANSKLLGSGASGSGAAYSEITLGTGLSMSGTTLNGVSSGGTITTASIIPPQTRLTLVTGTPVMTSDQTAKAHIYNTPYIGPNLPIYDGANWSLFTQSGDLDMALDTSNQLVENVYDLFAWNNSSTLSIGAGPAWTNTATITVTIATPAVVSWTGHGLPEGAPVKFTTTGALPTGITAGTTYYVGRSPGANSFNISTSVANAAAGTFVATSGSQSGTHTGTNHTTIRGTGAGTTELEMKNGIWVNKNSITLTNGAGGGNSVSADQATYLGSFYATANGQTGMAFRPAGASGGSAPILGLYNAYNRIRTPSLEMDTTASWTYATATWRASNGNANNRITFLDGLGQSFVDTRFEQFASATSTSAALYGVNLNATNATPTTNVRVGNNATANGATASAAESFSPGLGVRYVQSMEYAIIGTTTMEGNISPRQNHSLRVWLDL